MRRILIAATFMLALCACATADAKTYSGKLEVVHADDFKHGRGQTTWTLRTKNGRIPIRPTAVPRAGSGEKVAVRGRKAGRWLEGKVIRRGGPRIKAASALGNHSLAVILVNFADDTRQPWTPQQVQGRIFDDSDSTAAFYSEESYGDITLSGDVFGWYTIPRLSDPTSTDECNYSWWASKAREAATNAGHNLLGYGHIQYVFPNQSSCGWAGLGYMPGRDTFLNGSIEPWVAAHELGHNMGLDHSSSYRCTRNSATVTWSSSCTASEYGDPYDVMGTNEHHSNAWQLARLGVVPGSNIQTVSSTGTYTIGSALHRGAGTKLLRIPTGGSPARYYDISIRESGGVFDNFSASASIVNGVSIHWDSSLSTRTQSLLLDGTPSTNTFSDAPLPQGATFTDGETSVTVVSALQGQATVTVVLGAHDDIDAPTAPGSFAASAVQGGADLAWSASTDNIGVTGYRIVRDGSIVATTPALTYSDRNLAPRSTHSYRVQAMDAAGNAMSSALRWITVPAAPDPDPGIGAGGDSDANDDVTAPVVRVLSPKQRALLRRRAVILARASDDTGVARMELYIDGRRTTVVRAASLKRTWTLRGVRAGNHTLRIRAFDASGNAASRTVRVRVPRRP